MAMGQSIDKKNIFMFGTTYWAIIIVLTLLGSWAPWKDKVKDARHKKGYREVNEGTPFLSRLKSALILWFIVVTIIYGLIYLMRD
jgi:hypothetical protein